MKERIIPYDYFMQSFSEKEKLEQAKPRNEKGNPNNKEPEPKVIYLANPYPPPNPAHTGNPNSDADKIPWGFITVITIVGLVALSIVALTIGGKKG